MAQNPLALNDTTPAAPSGAANVKWQAATPDSDPTVLRNTSAYLPAATATLPGAVPTPPNDATKYLDGTGNFSVPAGSGGGSGGGGIYPAMTPPLSTNFTWENQGSSLAADKTGRLVLSIEEINALAARGLFQALPYSAPYTATVALGVVGSLVNGIIAYLMLSDGSGNWVGNGLVVATPFSFRRDTWTSNGASYGAGTQTMSVPCNPSLIWLRLVDDGSNRYFYQSLNGRDWVLCFTEGNTVGITPTQIGMAFYNNGGGNGVVAQGSVYHWSIVNSALPAVGA